MSTPKSKERYDKRLQEYRDRVRVEGAVAKVRLSQGLEATIDSDKAEIVSKYKWHVVRSHRCMYACANIYRDGSPTTLRLHRLIMGLGPESRVQVDHQDGNGLNNRRSNLRAATHAENQRNREVSANNRLGYKGVSPWRGKYRATIRGNGKQKWVGAFETVEEAAAAYNHAAIKHFGDFARLSTIPTSKPPSSSTPDKQAAIA